MLVLIWICPYTIHILAGISFSELILFSHSSTKILLFRLTAIMFTIYYPSPNSAYLASYLPSLAYHLSTTQFTLVSSNLKAKNISPFLPSYVNYQLYHTFILLALVIYSIYNIQLISFYADKSSSQLSPHSFYLCASLS